MLTLPNMAKDIKFEEDGHRYMLGTMQLPSVTQLLKPLYDFSSINPIVLENAAKRGTEVHYAIEKYIKYGYLSTLEGDAQLYFEQFLLWGKDNNVNRENFACEIIVYCKTYNFTGCIDLIYKDTQDKYHLLDIKTSSVADTKTWSVQLSGYALACKEYGITFDSYKVLQLATDSYRTHLLHTQDGIFLSCLNIHNYINSKG